MALLSFHRDQKIKQAILLRLQQHADADEIIKGHYWNGSTGCAIGCTIHSGNHSEYEIQLGVPHILARIQDKVAQILPEENTAVFPLQFIKTIPVGVSLVSIPYQFFEWLLIGSKYSLHHNTKSLVIKNHISELSQYIHTRLTKIPTDQERKTLNITYIALKELGKSDKAAHACYRIIDLFRNSKQAWNCDIAMTYSSLAYCEMQKSDDVSATKKHMENRALAMQDHLFHLLKETDKLT